MIPKKFSIMLKILILEKKETDAEGGEDGKKVMRNILG